jgi:DNA-binding response OmpR family regulator
MRLLVVEDTDKLAKALKRGLENEGYAVDTLGDGHLAQTRLRSRHDEYPASTGSLSAAICASVA